MLVRKDVQRMGKRVSRGWPGNRDHRMVVGAVALFAGILSLSPVPAGAAPPPGGAGPPETEASVPGGPFADFELELAAGRYFATCGRQGIHDLAIAPDGNVVTAGFSRRNCEKFNDAAIDVHKVLAPELRFSSSLDQLIVPFDDLANGVAVDVQGNVYITGVAGHDLFPVVDGLQGKVAGGFDAFVMKLDPTLQTILYSTFLGGTGDDVGTDIAVDDEGRIVVVGTTDSVDFPTASPLQGGLAGGRDVFVTVFEPDGSELAFSTYFGGAEDEQGKRLAVLRDRIFLTGLTSSPDLPTRVPGRGGGGVLASVYGGGPSDAFVARIDRFRRLGYAGFLGGSGEDVGYDVVVDRSGSAFVTGTTNSTDFPTFRAVQDALADPAEADAFLAQLAPSGSRARYSTYLDAAGSAVCQGRHGRFCTAVAVDEDGTAFVAASGFPAIAVSKNGRRILDRFALPLDSTSIAVAPDGSVYVGGATQNFTLPFIGADSIPRRIFVDHGGWLVRLTREPE
ncbi:MAG: SBBP repeat-containing protein [Thermoanaerobaculia bacterium]